MAEKLLMKIRIAGTDFAPVITTEAGIDTAVWEEQPLTYKGDEVSIVEADPTESTVESHENDSPEDMEISGSPIKAKGSFIKVAYQQMADLMGGKVTGTGSTAKYLHSSKKVLIETAIRFRLKNGGSFIIPKAKGYVITNGNMGADGLYKLPFQFTCLGQSDFETDYIIEDTIPVVTP